LKLNNNNGNYEYDWGRFDICKRACPEPTYLNLKVMVNAATRGIDLSDISSRSITLENAPPIQFPIKTDEY
jgi:hypothetical protein